MPKLGTHNAKNRKPNQTEPKVGEIRPMDLETPYGLFEGMDDDWYLIGSDPDYKLAIVLAHRELPTFTCLRLRPTPFTGGFWWGKFQVAAGPSVDDFRSTETGLMSGDSWPTLSLQCHGNLTNTQWIELGRVTKVNEDIDEAEGELGPDFPTWTILRGKDKRPIITRQEDGTVITGGHVHAGEEYVTHMKVKPCRS